MTENKQAQSRMVDPVLRTFARAPISSISRWTELEDGIGFCRISVIGEAPGPASNPPRVTFYVMDGGDPGQGDPLRPDEAKRCAANLKAGDWVELIGKVGPERDRADHQEVIVTEPVKLKERGPVWEDGQGEAVEQDRALVGVGA
jgi:hypothetical protein